MSGRRKAYGKLAKPIYATDVEWETIRERAAERGLTISEFILACAEVPDRNLADASRLSEDERERLRELMEWIAGEITSPIPKTDGSFPDPTPRQAIRMLELMGREVT